MKTFLHTVKMENGGGRERERDKRRIHYYVVYLYHTRMAGGTPNLPPTDKPCGVGALVHA